MNVFEKLDNLERRIMAMECGDSGYDLRAEVLELIEIVTGLAKLVKAATDYLLNEEAAAAAKK